jgi:hypothetical protein
LELSLPLKTRVERGTAMHPRMMLASCDEHRRAMDRLAPLTQQVDARRGIDDTNLRFAWKIPDIDDASALLNCSEADAARGRYPPEFAEAAWT